MSAARQYLIETPTFLLQVLINTIAIQHDSGILPFLSSGQALRQDDKRKEKDGKQKEKDDK